MQTIIADAGPIIHLAEANCLEVLTVLGSVVVPQAVADEVSCVLSSNDWRSFVSVVILDERQKRYAQIIASSAGLHLGESEALEENAECRTKKKCCLRRHKQSVNKNAITRRN